MRPAILNPLFAPARSLKGVGEKVEKLLAAFLRGPSVGEARLVDLIFHLPTGVIDRRQRPLIRDLPQSGVVTVHVTVGRHKPPPRFKKGIPYRVEVFDETGALTLTFFHGFTDTIQRQLPEGEQRYISGVVSWYDGQPQISHADYILSAEEFGRMPLVDPVYPLTAGLSPKILGRLVREAVKRTPPLPEWQDPAFLARNAWPSFPEALAKLHRPQSASAVDPSSPAHMRIAYDELLANQLALSLVRANMKRTRGRSLKGDGSLTKAIGQSLPYHLTSAQREALKTIFADMGSEERMLRLLQGDVGSGKTVVALLALARAVEAGAQGALMVPTEILARQHLAGIAKLAHGTSIRIDILTGREKGKAREIVLQRLQNGAIDILIGTHAIFQDGVEFRDLGLVVIDEQHRFGVHQRLALQDKAARTADLLVMTATPIPRTLALTVYGDMDVSKLTEKPPGRQPVDTRVLPIARLDEVVGSLRRAMESGTRAYWVCPLVGESELVDLAAAEERHAHLAAALGTERVGLLHGKMRPSEKDEVMAAFKEGRLSILVSTTVIEVGVDVPEASVMVIENAERFGLAQLHQLRGRVGRGAAKSNCLLLYQEPLGETAKARLSIMRETEDGFRIAEEDLRLRGAGEMLGTQQAGLPLFKVADLSVHGDLLAAARDDAALILQKDAKLAGERGAALRTLLYLFEREAAVSLLSSG